MTETADLINLAALPFQTPEMICMGVGDFLTIEWEGQSVSLEAIYKSDGRTMLKWKSGNLAELLRLCADGGVLFL